MHKIKKFNDYKNSLNLKLVKKNNIIQKKQY